MNSKTGPAKVTQSERLLHLLDKAYEAPFQPDNFHELMKAAHNFYFESWDDLSVTDIKSANFANDSTLASHLNRIELLIRERELENRSHATNLNKPTLIALLINPDTWICEGNHLAAEFFGQRFPCAFKELKLEKSSLNQLKKMAQRALSSGFNNEICRVKRSDTNVASLAKCGVWINPEDNDTNQKKGLAVSIAHFNWTPNALGFCQSMFQLADSETSVLAALLNGKTQAEIAAERGRSVETIKAQAKSILRKSGCSKVSDLMVLATTYGLLVDPGGERGFQTGDKPLDFARPDQIFMGKDGRKISYGIHGDPNGQVVLFVHGLVHGPFFPADMIAAFKKDGLKVIAPSRPGFGLSDPPESWKDFDETVIQDALSLLDAKTKGPVTVVAHQGGVSHACRITNAPGERAKNMVMIGAGIPIDEKRHLEGMGLQTRIAAMGVKYTPRLLETMIRIGIANELRRGVKPYLHHLFSNSPIDQNLLDDPNIYPICEAGILHMIEQGPKAMVNDGAAAMADWSSDLLSIACPVTWVHGTMDPIMRLDFVLEYVGQHRGDPVIEVENGAGNMHLSHADICYKAILDAARN
jgi:pimeloyl-ACP methyl ester carboxylesterase/DNA-binding CsgD family transcriptional regulator